MSENADLPETLATYLRLRGLKAPNRRRKRVRIDEDDPAAPFMPGRDPHSIDSVLADLTKKSGWDPLLAQEDLLQNWKEVAGDETAQHTTPVGLADGVLQPDLVAEVAVEDRLRGAELAGDLVHREVGASAVHGPAGGVRQLGAARDPVALPPGGAAVGRVRAYLFDDVVRSHGFLAWSVPGVGYVTT